MCSAADRAPASWVLEHAHLLPSRGEALDLACGRGRHSIWLAERGLHVRAIDRNQAAIDMLRELARQRRLPIDAQVRDIEVPNAPFGEAAFDVIVCVHYLHRPLFPAIRRALRPGGILIYETFTLAQARRGRPTNPDFLLAPGELATWVAPLDIVDAREGAFDDRDVASVVARRPSSIPGLDRPFDLR